MGKLTKLLGALATTGFLVCSSCELAPEPDEPKSPRERDGVFENFAPEGVAPVFGEWYKPEEGVTKDGWKWYWATLFLEQNGNEVWGSYRWELYDAEFVEGTIEGDYLTLSDRNGGGIEGRIIDGKFRCINNMDDRARSAKKSQVFYRVNESPGPYRTF